MDTTTSILETAKETFTSESKSIMQLSEYLTDDFAEAVKLILTTTGRVVVTGIGKSALIGAKIVATFNSTGTEVSGLSAL